MDKKCLDGDCGFEGVDCEGLGRKFMSSPFDEAREGSGYVSGSLIGREELDSEVDRILGVGFYNKVLNVFSSIF